MPKQYSKKASDKIGVVMKEFYEGELHSGKSGKGKGPVVTNPSQAKAIGLSEARRRGYKVPPAKKK